MAPNLIAISGEHGPKKDVALVFKTLCDNMKKGTYAAGNDNV